MLQCLGFLNFMSTFCTISLTKKMYGKDSCSRSAYQDELLSQMRQRILGREAENEQG